ncbi:MAG: hypothetical protein QNK37_09535 [Acidobacteriota bacterium]|nr:hypothetical protein [Acidobacteriota bacterium]
MKKKLSLNELNVSSFVVVLEHKKRGQGIQGGEFINNSGCSDPCACQNCTREPRTC